MTLTKPMSHGLSILAGYTYGHGLDNGSLNRFGTLPQDSLNPATEYASSDFDIRHRFTLTASYEIPGPKGFGQLLKGLKLNSILNIQTAQPWIAFDASNNFGGSADNSDRWDFFGNPADFKSGSSSISYCGFDYHGVLSCSEQSGVSGIVSELPTSLFQQSVKVAPDAGTLHDGGCFVSGNSVMVPPKVGTFSTMGRNLFRDTGFKSVDFSVFKTFKFKERYNATFRFEIFQFVQYPKLCRIHPAHTVESMSWERPARSAAGAPHPTWRPAMVREAAA